MITLTQFLVAVGLIACVAVIAFVVLVAVLLMAGFTERRRGQR